MILDAHIHIDSDFPKTGALLDRLHEAGVDGGILFSLPPPTFRHKGLPSGSAEQRLDSLLTWTSEDQYLYPFYWIDPVDRDAHRQVEYAASRGAKGFKVICDRFFPSDSRAMDTFKNIADTGLPILFHSGILWDDSASSKYNRPVEFECLFFIPGLRFALSHLSWPWSDEHIAFVGKHNSIRKRHAGFTSALFSDLTPGTPPLYREETLKRLFLTGYSAEEIALFGSDQLASAYDPEHVRALLDTDQKIMEMLGISESAIGNYHSGNLRRFLEGNLE
jgi:predicted TIM-barrel fold metal-dependent hydrolase